MKFKTTEEVLTMCKKKHLIALIGCGAVAKLHLEVALALENTKVVGVFDNCFERAQAFAEPHGIVAFASMEDLLASDAEIVSICTPSGLHAEIAIRCMEHGKHVVVEKPIALTEQDCDRILEVEHATGKICAPISEKPRRSLTAEHLESRFCATSI